MPMLDFWIIMPCALVGKNHRFRGKYCLHYKGESSFGTMFIFSNYHGWILVSETVSDTLGINFIHTRIVSLGMESSVSFRNAEITVHTALQHRKPTSTYLRIIRKTIVQMCLIRTALMTLNICVSAEIRYYLRFTEVRTSC